jgi:S-adenosylmethionine decarboxylase
MMLKDINLDDYLFDIDADDLKPSVRKRIYQQLEKEMLEIFYGRNIPKQ